MGRAASVLSGRAGAIALILAALVVYYAVSESLWSTSDRWDVAFLAAVLLPVVFTLVLLALPARHARGLLPFGLALAALAALLGLAGLDVASNFAKLAAVTAIGFWFLGYFETANWVALVAFIIPWVDAWSVFRGPTGEIVENHGEVFGAFSFAFPIPGEQAAANLGLPDFLFFALFLAATARFGLRQRLTWAAMTASFGLTMVLAVGFDVIGLPALPLLSLAFLAVNADLLWRRARQREAAAV